MKKALLYIFYFANLGTIFYFWLHGSGSLFADGGTSTLLALGRLAGLLLAFSTLTQFMLIGRIKWIEPLYGLDKLSRVHKWNGYSLSLFLILHPLFIVLSYAQLSDSAFFAQLWFMVRNVEDVLAALLAVLLLGTVITLSIRIARKRLKYETWYYVHLLTYAAILLAFNHQLKLGGDLLGSKVFTNYWYALYAFVAANFLWFRFLRPLYLYSRHRFTVARVVQETYDTVSIYISGKNLAGLKSKPGQFIIVRFLDRAYWSEAHPFSLSYIPKNNELRITPKGVGDFTKTLPNLKPGTKVLIDGPHGAFTSAKKKHNKTLLIAGGVGITPLRALAEELSAKNENMVLLYGNKSSQDILFEKELSNIASRAPLTIYHIMSSPEPAWQGLTGYIDKEKLVTLVPDFKERDIFLCGPPVMMDLVRNMLRSLGVPRSQIIWEKFSL